MGLVVIGDTYDYWKSVYDRMPIISHQQTVENTLLPPDHQTETAQFVGTGEVCHQASMWVAQEKAV